MPDTVKALTSRLLTAIDSEGNVTDMSIVLDLVGLLENTNVTAEDLKITRLGKFINLIRRKIADVDKQLSKRLKKLVKQWQLLLQSKIPNGIVPPAPPAPPAPAQACTVALSSQPVSSPLSSYDSGYGSQSAHITPSPTDPTRSFPSSSSINDLKANSSSNNSFSARDPSRELSLGNSRDSGSCTPTPSSPTPPISHPGQTAPNTTKNRFQMMQKLSSVKSTSVSPNKTASSDNVTVATSSNSSSKYPSLPSSHTSQTNNSHSSILHKNQTTQSYDPLPSRCGGGGGGGGPLEAVTEAGSVPPPGDDTHHKPWTTSSFTEIKDTVNGINLVFGRDGAAMADHSHLDTAYARNSKKRERMSDSPGEVSIQQQPPKRHKPDGNKSKRDKGEMLIRVPLDKVCLGRDNKTLQEEEKMVEFKVSATVTEGNGELIVSFQRSKLNKLPMFWDRVSTLNDGSYETPFSSRTSIHPPAHHNPPIRSHSPPSHNNYLCSPLAQDSSLCKNNDQINIRPEIILDSKHFDENTHLQDPIVCSRLHDDIDDHTLSNRTVLAPHDALPGISGCVGLDGYWYNWTDHICSHGDEVTILPYVYVEDS